MATELTILSYPAKPNQIDWQGASIVACPDPPSDAVKVGKAIPVPRGRFSVDLISDLLPAGFTPELIQMSARDMTFLPYGLSRFKCPKVMKLGDTNHLGNGSLTEMIAYCKELSCDYHWLYQGVQHLHFFIESGLKNVVWLPVSIVIEYVEIGKTVPEYDVVFRGGISSVHWYRSYVMEQLRQSKYNISIETKNYLETLQDYAKSKIIVNCSGGSDFNRRVFEALMTGSFLITDRLSRQSGLFSLLKEGTHFECYGSVDELKRKIDYYLNNDWERDTIASEGHQLFLTMYHPNLIKNKFYNFIFNNSLEPIFKNVEHDKRCYFQPENSSPTRYLPKSHKTPLLLSRDLERRLEIYELIQSIHQINIGIHCLYWRCGDLNFLADILDLPRITVTCVTDSKNSDLINDFCKNKYLDCFDNQLNVFRYQEDFSWESCSLNHQNQKFSLIIIDSCQLVNEEDLEDIENYSCPKTLLIILNDQSHSHSAGKIRKKVSQIDGKHRLKNWREVEILDYATRKSFSQKYSKVFKKAAKAEVDGINFLQKDTLNTYTCISRRMFNLWNRFKWFLKKPLFVLRKLLFHWRDNT